MLLNHEGKDSVVISVQMRNPGQTWNCTGILVSVGYNPMEIHPAFPVSIYNKYFQQFGWTDASKPFAENDGQDPDILSYIEFTLNDWKPVSIASGSSRILCRVQFAISRNASGLTDISFVGNDTGNGITGWLQKGDPVQHPFAAVYGLKNVLTPVEFLKVSAYAIDRGVVVEWSTVYEVNNAAFVLERWDDDYWKDIKTVAPRGEPSTGASYMVIDRTVKAGRKYLYRIRQVDHDGTVNYSSIMRVEVLPISGSFDLGLYPNPASAQSIVQLFTSNEEVIGVELYNSLGKRVMSLPYRQYAPGTHTLAMDLSILASGIYHVIAHSSDGIRTLSFVMRR
ncbi:MAG: T9SS type A sorting domain-containing protein [Chlorobi bacterium]|nr:T9SS type A sorting domain-containing protein [Chlorobiota bacterium]